jgi:hypothetical protein
VTRRAEAAVPGCWALNMRSRTHEDLLKGKLSSTATTLSQASILKECVMHAGTAGCQVSFQSYRAYIACSDRLKLEFREGDIQHAEVADIFCAIWKAYKSAKSPHRHNQSWTRSDSLIRWSMHAIQDKRGERGERANMCS